MKSLLIEIGVAELPIDDVENLSKALLIEMQNTLQAANIDFNNAKRYATARRLALHFDHVDSQQQDTKIEKKGPALKAAKDGDGNWTKAAIGFASSFKISPEALTIKQTPKGDWLYYCGTQKGQATQKLMPELLKSTIEKLPITKHMRWGNRNDSFTRPVNTLAILHENQVIDATLFNITSGNAVLGHRFHGDKTLTILHADEYVDTLKNSFVIADLDLRKEMIVSQAKALVKTVSPTAKVVINETTLNEVNALVELPVAIIGKFDPRYLHIPKEVLIKTMQDHQKYFAITDENDELLPFFITISNIQSQQPDIVIKGNQKVIEPRFADAEFFWNNDKKQSLAARQEQLKKTIYQKQLGSLFDRSARIAKIAEYVATSQSFNPTDAIRAALLAKCDLVTEMVFEFGELQGVIGEYYAQNDGENTSVCSAIREQYLPKFSGDALPQTQTGLTVSLADKIENIVGGFSVGAKPTGTKDPYALRRASLGVIRLLNETELDVSLNELLNFAINVFSDEINASAQLDEINLYINERLRNYYQEQNVRHDIFNAVNQGKNSKTETLKDFSAKINALSAFISHEDASNVFAANKRMGNFLKKTQATTALNKSLLNEPAEKQLYQAFSAIKENVSTVIAKKSYEQALQELSTLRTPLDQFFDDIMVLVEDKTIKNNRLALLTEIFDLFSLIGDLSQIES